MDTKIVRKISMKILGVQQAAKDTRKTGKPIALARIWGIARGVKGVTTDLGVANALIGNFEAVSLIDRQSYAAPKLFLPAGADEIIVAGLEGSNGVQFALEFGAEPDDSQIGYRYTVRSLIKPAENDALQLLRSQANPFAAEQKQVAAPEQKQVAAPEQKQVAAPEQPKQAAATASAGAHQEKRSVPEPPKKK